MLTAILGVLTYKLPRGSDFRCFCVIVSIIFSIDRRRVFAPCGATSDQQRAAGFDRRHATRRQLGCVRGRLVMIARVLRDEGILSDPERWSAIEAAQASPTCQCKAAGHDAIGFFGEPEPPPLPRYHAPENAMPLVSVLTPTTSDRHWAHANLYRCFAAQSWPSKELIILDTGSSASPFFSSLKDSRVRYTHLAFPTKMAKLLAELNAFVAAASSPPCCGATTSGTGVNRAWEAVWAPVTRRVRAAEAGISWWELEDDEVECDPNKCARAPNALSMRRAWRSGAHSEGASSNGDHSGAVVLMRRRVCG